MKNPTEASARQSKKQNAIFGSLKRYLPHDQLMQAMLLWEDKYAQQPGFAVRYFANDVSKIANETVKPKELVTQMVIALNAHEEKFEDAAPIIDEYRIRNKLMPRALVASPEVSALNVLLTKLVELTSPNMRKDVCAAIVKQLKTKAVNSNVKIQMLRWLEDNTYTMRPPSADIADLRTAFGAAYAGYCETLGPVKTDTLLSDALQRLESNGGAIYSDIFKQIL